MSSVKGTNITILDSTVNDKIERTDVGKKRVWVDTYEASSLASGSDITVCRIPAGSAIVGVTVYHDAMGASTTLVVGDASDDNRFITSGSTSSAGVKTLNAIDGVSYIYTTETDLVMTTGGGAATGTYKILVEYLV